MTTTPPVVVLRSSSDVVTATDIREALFDLTEPAVVDLTQVRQLDAGALGALAAVARRVGLGKLTLVVPRGNLSRLMKLVGFPSLCRVITDRREKPSPLGARLSRRHTDRTQTENAPAPAAEPMCVAV
ncbi:MAG TPA: STAS domain-containing protein [Candidatus Elarobacter sp.]|jgi:anti-anti-sigma regulatory factor|nr:STAS domain-containing protein [Candidatus Elarobacter sp.]